MTGIEVTMTNVQRAVRCVLASVTGDDDQVVRAVTESARDSSTGPLVLVFALARYAAQLEREAHGDQAADSVSAKLLNVLDAGDDD